MDQQQVCNHKVILFLHQKFHTILMFSLDQEPILIDKFFTSSGLNLSLQTDIPEIAP